MWDAWSLGRASWEPIIAICEVLREVVGTCVRCCNAAAACAEAGTSVARLALHLASFLFFFFSRLSDGTHIHTHTHAHIIHARPALRSCMADPSSPQRPSLCTPSSSWQLCLRRNTCASPKKKKRNRIPFFFLHFHFAPSTSIGFFFLFFFYFFFFPCILVQPVYSTRFPDSIVKTRTLFRSCLFFFSLLFRISVRVAWSSSSLLSRVSSKTVYSIVAELDRLFFFP